MSEKKRVIVIDDEKNIRMTLEKALSGAGYEVDTAMNGENGIQKLKEKEYPVVLLDMRLPGIDGIEVLKRINSLDYKTKVIMITGYGNVETAVETMKLGAVDYLRKPFKPGEIKEIVEQVFGRYKLEENEQGADNFREYLNLAKAAINERDFEKAIKFLKKATSLNSEKPEPFNLLGIIYELRRNQPEAMKMYRAALALDPTYKPADENLQRASDMSNEGDLDNVNLGEEEE